MFELQVLHGVGVNATYGVFRDRKRVGTMRRHGSRYPWSVTSPYYAEDLGGVGFSIEEARKRVETLDYPTAEEVYERVCQRTEAYRRKALEEAHHADFVRLSRSIVFGSNSAQAELAALITEIDARVIDRADTEARWHVQREAAFQRWKARGEKGVNPFSDDENPYRPVGQHSYWFYPLPPAEEAERIKNGRRY